MKTSKEHYKMYKQGRFWVFAGITVATIGISPLVSHADTTGNAAASDGSQTTTDTTKHESGNQVTLHQSATSETENSGSTSDGGNESVNTGGSSSVTAPATDQQSTTTTTPDTTTKQTETGRDQAPVASAEKTATKQTDTATTQPTETESQTGNTGTDQVQATNSTENKGTDSTPAASTDEVKPATNTVEQPTTETTVTTNQTTSVEPETESLTDPVTPTVQKKASMMRAAAEPAAATIVQNGTFGTSEWRLDSDGVLTIGAGTWGDIATANGTWYQYLINVSKVVIEGPVIAGNSLAYAFFRNNNNAMKNPITEFVGLDQIDTSRVTNMKQMFSGNQVADFSGVTNWDVSHVTDINSMFGGNHALTQIDLSQWDVSNVTNMQMLFAGDIKLNHVDLSSWAPMMGKVTMLSSMFSNNTSLTDVNVDNWDLSSLEDAQSMFASTPNLKVLDLSSWKNISKLVKTFYMFYGDAGLTSLNLSSLPTNNMLTTVNATNQGMLNMEGYDYDTFNLKSLTLNSQAILQFTPVPVKEVVQSEINAGLPAIPKGGIYTGNWVNAADATMVKSSAELMAMYDGTNNPTDTITWVWQTAPSQSELTAKDVDNLIAGHNTTWNVGDSVASLKDFGGNDITADASTNVVVKSVNGDPNVTTVDTTKAGTYTVVLGYTDEGGTERVATSTVTVVANQGKLVAKDTTIKMGPNASFDVTRVVDQANSLNADGSSLSAAQVETVTAAGLDLTQAGKQTVTLTYVDETGTAHTTDITVEMVASSAELTFNVSEVIKGPKAEWDYLDAIKSVTDFDGNAIDQSKWDELPISQTENQPDLDQLGEQTVTFTYTDELGNVHSASAIVNVVASQAKLVAKEDQIVWAKDTDTVTPANLVASLTGADGKAVTDFSSVTMSSFDPTGIGAQTLTLTYVDSAGNVKTVTVNVTVDHATITTQDTQPYAGPGAVYDYVTNLVTVTDSSGNAVALNKAQIIVTNKPNMLLDAVGNPQTVTFEYTDDLKQVQTVTATVTTTASKATITAVDPVIVMRADADGVTVKDLVASVTDENGAPVTDLSRVTMTPINTAMAGPQTITLTYTDPYGNAVTAQTTVTVDQAKITTKDTQPLAGPTAKWDYLTSLDRVTNSKGERINIADANVKVVTGPDMSVAMVGKPQLVTLVYTDDLEQTQTVTTTVTTVATKASVTAVKPQIIWPATADQLTVKDLVAGVVDANGESVTDLSAVTMSGFDPQQNGAQTVTLTYTDAAGNRVTDQTTVTVDRATLTTMDSQPIAGPDAKWDYRTSLSGATDSNGQAIDVNNVNVKVITAPDMSNAHVGVPQTVVLAYTDNLGLTQRVNATVTTVKSQASLVGKDQTILSGPNAKWTLADSVDWTKSLAADGTALTPSEVTKITADGTPDLTKPGTYTLTLHYLDAVGNLLTDTDTATVKVVASQADLQVKDSQLTVGESWRADDNLVSVKDANGAALTASAVTVSGAVDPNKAGTYQVTYTYTDGAGNVLTRTATITVVAKTTDPGNGDNGGTTEPGDGDNGNTEQPGNNDQGNGGTDTTGDGDALKPGASGNTDTPTGQADGVTASKVETGTAVKPATAAARPSQSGLPQTDETTSPAQSLGTILLGLTGLLGAWGATSRRRRKQ